ncbi:Phosphatidylinositol 4-phosphate 5-kinase type-1 alpha-like [Balamuthia mandrillaris]
MEEDRGGEAVRPNREAAASLLSQALMKAFLYSVNEIEEEEGEEMEERKDIFREKHIYKSRTTDLKSKMVIKAYSPVAYTSLRQMFGFSASDYVSSWKETLIENESSSLQKGLSGKSGSLFLFSKDQRFILKTLPVAESQALRRLLPSYHQHMRENPRSLLARMLGHYRLAFSGGGGGGGRASPLHVVIQHNIFSTASLRLDFVFDLKGATRKRKATEEEKKKPRHVLKDVDFVESGRVFHVGEQLKQVLFEEMEKDCKLLESAGIMDYSLLVGIHSVQTDETDDDEDAASLAKRTKKKKNKKLHHKIAKKLKKHKASNEDETGEQEPELQLDDRDIFLRGSKSSFFLRLFLSLLLSHFLPKVKSSTGEEIYLIGIIDILCNYAVKKRMASFWKRTALASPKATLSTVEPTYYSRRFQEWLYPKFD